MAITINIYYKGTGSAAKQFAKEMTESGTVDAIRKAVGNLRYEYFSPLYDEETVLLIDSWESQEAIDIHHASPMMNTIVELREKYDLHMRVERYVSDDGIPDSDRKFIKEKTRKIYTFSTGFIFLLLRFFKSSVEISVILFSEENFSRLIMIIRTRIIIE